MCGDIDGDSYDDLILSSPFGDSESNARGDAGEVYVIFGAARDNLDSYIDLRATAPDIMIYGAAGGDRAGFSLALGNVIGDNNLDIIKRNLEFVKSVPKKYEFKRKIQQRSNTGHD